MPRSRKEPYFPGPKCWREGRVPRLHGCSRCRVSLLLFGERRDDTRPVCIAGMMGFSLRVNGVVAGSALVHVWKKSGSRAFRGEGVDIRIDLLRSRVSLHYSSHIANVSDASLTNCEESLMKVLSCV